MRILLHGDSPSVATGYGNINRLLIKELIKIDKSLDFTVIGIADMGGWKDPNIYFYKIYPAIYNNYNDELGLTRLVSTLMGEDPEIHGKFDVLIYHNDMFHLDDITIDGKKVIDWIYEVGKNVKKKIIYTLVDTDQLKLEWGYVLAAFDYIVVPTKYSRNIITKHFPDLKNRIHVVQYAIDTELFYPQKKERTDGFTIGYVGRNQWRKNIQGVISAFDMFRHKHKTGYLYLHTKAEDKGQFGCNPLELLKDKGYYLTRDYYVPTNLNVNKGVKRETMNDIYNKFDVFLSASVGEGYGMPYIEAMLAGVPVIAPDNSTVPELLGNGRGYIYKNKMGYSFGWIDYNRVKPMPDMEDALCYLEKVYDAKIGTRDGDDVQEMIYRARSYALQFTPNKMAEEFYKVLV